jgi:two-component system, NarL family, invasion response regulator UvrY
MTKRIIILDDEPLIPVLIKEMIEEEQELEISQITADKGEFLDSVKQNSFDAALIDISVGGREGGIELLQILKNKNINLPSIILSAHDERNYALKCLHAGAMGYISKNCICTDLIRGLKAVFRGNTFVSGERGDYILKQYKE